MMQVNTPLYEWVTVQCYKCRAIFEMHPLQNINAEFVTNCNLHPKDKQQNDK